VAIVGGGMTGAMLAEAFSRDGVRVAVVEAARIGLGSTAASTALLLQEPDYDLKALSERYGNESRSRSGSRARMPRAILWTPFAG
jgi:glycine/D-amino acid oxidase-like deaminating enzyme